MELVTRVKYEWKGTAIDDITKGKEKNTVEESFDIDSIYNDIFEYANNKFIITNGNNVLYYDKKNNELRIYHKLNTDTDYCTDPNEVIKKFNKLGLLLSKRYKQEETIITGVFDQDINLQYKADKDPFS